jgi:probable O-glycosylation ligase (exosortase A-associated)
MRDIAVTLAVFGALPFILRKPWFGIIVWTWLGFMNPHRLAWGFSTTMPFAYIVALTTLAAMLFSREPKQIPWTRESRVLFAFVIWMIITTVFAVYPALAQEQLTKVLKIQLMIFVAMMLITDKERLNWLVLTIALSIGFYGFKGGIFTIVHGGVYRVQGPSSTFIGGNNELGLAMAMTVPLLYYCGRQSSRLWLRLGLFTTMVLSAVAAIGTQSRGALLGMTAMGVMFWLKSRQKFAIAFYAAIAILLVLAIMPPEWYQRLSTIRTYDEDQSAMGRINAWWMAWNLAKSRLLGGGFETFQYGMFQLYAPDPGDYRDVHSIYFEVLGEHGFVGLGLFLLLAAFTWLSASRLIRATKAIPEMRWLGELAAVVQVSMLAYATAGAFLGMAYFDYYYNLVLIIIVGRVILERHLAERSPAGRKVGEVSPPNGMSRIPSTRAAR